ncbi:hypothetical protein ABIA33_006420 [Streptacidiphilus sp. MAP12-16]|uniref:hypothetical protein n=1 Tax=Streptacidiphilus sp. MAP12-16 TaxID=3156300 RepID=UPI003515CBDB
MRGDRQFQPPTEAQHLRIQGDLLDLARKWARELAQVGEDGARSPFLARAAGDQDEQQGVLGFLAAQNQLLKALEPSIAETALIALNNGTDYEDVAAVLGVTRQAVVKRWGHQRRNGERVAVVISRRDRVREYPDDPRGRVGEVGGIGQYDSDRGVWPIGAKVRAEARYAIVAVEGTVRRVYAIASASWEEVEPRLWQFAAVGDRQLTAKEIAAAHQTFDLPLQPGDECPTRVGGAYRPHWF